MSYVLKPWKNFLNGQTNPPQEVYSGKGIGNETEHLEVSYKTGRRVNGYSNLEKIVVPVKHECIHVTHSHTRPQRKHTIHSTKNSYKDIKSNTISSSLQRENY